MPCGGNWEPIEGNREQSGVWAENAQAFERQDVVVLRGEA